MFQINNCVAIMIETPAQIIEHREAPAQITQKLPETDWHWLQASHEPLMPHASNT